MTRATAVRAGTGARGMGTSLKRADDPDLLPLLIRLREHARRPKTKETRLRQWHVTCCGNIVFQSSVTARYLLLCSSRQQPTMARGRKHSAIGISARRQGGIEMKRDGGTKRGVARGSAFAVALVALSMMTLPPTLATAGGGIVSTFESSLGTAAAHPEKGRRALGSQRGKVHLQMLPTSQKGSLLRRAVLTIRSGSGPNAAMLKVEATQVATGLERFMIQHVAPAQDRAGVPRRVLTQKGQTGSAPHDVVFTDTNHPEPQPLDLSKDGTPQEVRLATTIERDTHAALRDGSAFKGLEPAIKTALTEIAKARYPAAALVENAMGFIATALDE